MRKNLAIVLFVSILSVSSVVTAYASTLPVEQQMTLKHEMLKSFEPMPFFEMERPPTTVMLIVSPVKTMDGIKTVSEPRCNSPGYR